jgi:predicted trehalose synthase
MVFENRERIEDVLRGLLSTVGTPKAVTHGDLHLGQVLRRASDGGLLFVDFEGEPERSPGERHAKMPPLRDVATMNRSFSYVTHYAWRDFLRGNDTAAVRLLTRAAFSPAEEAVAERLHNWERAATERFVAAYLQRAPHFRHVEPASALRAIRGWMTEKALYELRYELRHRPANIYIPLEGVMSLAARAQT